MRRIINQLSEVFHSRHLSNKILLPAIFLPCLLLRVIFLFTLPPTAIWPDEAAYYNMALNIHSGEGYTNEIISGLTDSFRDTPIFNSKGALNFAPGVPYTLSVFLYLTGPSGTKLRLFQCLLMSLLPVLVFILAALLFDARGVGLLAAVIAIVYPYFIYLSSILLPQSLFSLLLVATMIFLVLWLRSNHLIYLMLTGFLHSLACLFVVPMIFTIIPLSTMVVIRFLRRRIPVAHFVVFSFSWLVLLLPYVYHVSVVNGRFTLITKESDESLYYFNDPDLSAMEVLTHTHTEESQKRVRQRLSLLEGPKHERAMASFKETLETHPIIFVRNCLLRLIAFFSPVTFTITKTKHTGTLAVLAGLLIYLPLFILFIIVAVRSLLERDWVIIQVLSLLPFFLVPHIIVVSNIRYRLPWDAIIISLAANWLYPVYRRVVTWFIDRRTSETSE